MRNITRRTMLRAALSAAVLPAACAEATPLGVGDASNNSSAPNLWGVNTFLHLDSERWRKKKTLEMAARAGIGWIKQHFPWDDIESASKGQFVHPTWKFPTWDKYDEIVELAEEAGLKIIARVDRTPGWARPENSSPTEPPTDPDDYGDFISAMVHRYGGRIRHFQIWNEPNLAIEWGGNAPDAARYVRLLETAFSAAVSQEPETVILGAPLAATLEMSDRAHNELVYFQQVYDAGGADYFHVHSANAFGLAFPPEAPPNPDVLNFRRVELSRAVMEQNGDARKPIWFNEYGWNASPADFPADHLTWARVTEDQQAEWTVRGVEFARANWPWAGVFNIWFLRRPFADIDPSKSEYYFRMIDPDFTPRMIYKAVAKAANER